MAAPRFALALLLGLALPAALPVALPACSRPSGESGAKAGVKEASPGKARELIEKGATVLDVREPDETAFGVLSQAKLAPTSKLKGEAAWKAELAALPKDKPVVVYCASGVRSAKIAERLSSEGYEAYNAGGYDDLKAAGLAVRKP